MHSNKQASDRGDSVMLTILLSKFRVFTVCTFKIWMLNPCWFTNLSLQCKHWMLFTVSTSSMNSGITTYTSAPLWDTHFARPTPQGCLLLFWLLQWVLDKCIAFVRHMRPKLTVCILYGTSGASVFIRLCMGIYQIFQNGRICAEMLK